MRVFVTGDVHRMHDIAKVKRFSKLLKGDLTADDYLIVCGDFGGVWCNNLADIKFLRGEYGTYPYKILFVDGNHENYDLLNAYPVMDWKGGKVHCIRENVFHLMRGEVFTLSDSCKIFAFGGAMSTDRGYGMYPERPWWAAELPSEAEYEYGLNNLELHGNKVDYIVTHDCGYNILRNRFMFDRDLSPELSGYFDFIAETIDFKHWYFGHHHEDMTCEKFTCLYNTIEELEVS